VNMNLMRSNVDRMDMLDGWMNVSRSLIVRIRIARAFYSIPFSSDDGRLSYGEFISGPDQ
jgi:hypothetical protein